MPAEVPLEIDCQSVRNKLATAANFVLIDCREPPEHAMANIPAARLIPMSQWDARASELEPLRHHEIVVHCHHGGRSLKVAQWLRGQGFSTARSMAGGIDAWSQEIDPTTPRY